MTTIVLNTKISEVETKIADTSGLVTMTTTVLNTNISEVENKIPSIDAKIKNIEGKCFTNAD